MVRTRSMRKTSQPTPKIPPSDVITEILYRLPAKSVGRFRCVSKGWLSLLTDPQFIKTHKEKTLKQNHLIFSLTNQFKFGNYKSSVNLYSHSFHERVVTTPAKFSLELECGTSIKQVRFSSSCDGLVLLRVYWGIWPIKLLLVNPTTWEIMQFPQDYIYSVAGNLRAEVSCGFGYDSVTDDYKVVTLIYFNYYSRKEDVDNAQGVYVYVYSLKSKTWRRVIKMDSPYNVYSLDGVFLNGLIYWIASYDTYRHDLCAIAAFCLADETFSEVLFPKSCNLTSIGSCELVVLGEKLAIFIQDKGEIWLMNEFGVRESWTKISLCEINKIPIFKQEDYRKNILVMDDNDKILVANNDRMMVYDVDKGTFSETVCIWDPKNFSVLGSYVESLVSLKHNITEPKSTNSSEEKEEDLYDEDVENENVEDDREDEDVKDDAEDVDTCKGHGPNISEFPDGENRHHERQIWKRKDIGSSNLPSKHIRVDSYSGSTDIPESSSRDLLDPETGLHLAQEDVGISNDATIQYKLVEIQALVEKNEELLEKSRALDTANAVIESLKAKLALAEELVRRH